MCTAKMVKHDTVLIFFFYLKKLSNVEINEIKECVSVHVAVPREKAFLE